MRVITLPNGKQVSLAVYVNAWRELKRLPADQDAKGWEWFSVSTQSVLRDMRAGMMDRINKRGQLEVREISEHRAFTLWQRALARGAIVIECRGCGQRLERVNPNNTQTRYCSNECRAA